MKWDIFYEKYDDSCATQKVLACPTSLLNPLYTDYGIYYYWNQKFGNVLINHLQIRTSHLQMKI